MLMLNVWPFVIIAILVAPAAPSHKQDSVDKRYSNAPKEFKSKFNARPQEVSQELSKKSLTPVARTLLNLKDAQAMLTKTTSSPFIQGMVKGTLPEEQYNAFLMQDAHYLSRGRNILRETSILIQDTNPQFANMYNIQAGKYDKYYQSLLNELGVPDVDSVVLRPATAEYEQFLTELSKKHPLLLAIGFLPCSQSFRFISGQLVEEAKAQDSKYKQFFINNFRQPGYESELETFINRKVYERVFKVDDIIPTYLQGMKNEENFIEAAKA